MSKVSGSLKTSSSRLADVWKKTTLSPAAMVVPLSSTSHMAVRRKFMTGVTKRSISSTARGQEAAVPDEALPLRGVLEEGVHGAGHEVAGRLVAGDGEEKEEQLELQVAQALALDLDRGEHAHEVGVRVDPLLPEELGGVGVEVHGGVQRHFRVGLVLGILVPDHAVGPVEHAVAVLLGHAEQLGDDLERELGRDLGDEVGLALLDHLVDDGVGGAVDALLEIAHHAGSEPLVDEAPVAGVQRRVHVEHHQALLGDLVRVHLEGHGALGGGAEALVVPVHGDTVLVAGDDPEPRAAGLVLPVDGVVAAQMRQPGVGDTGHVGPGVREVDGGDVRQRCSWIDSSSDVSDKVSDTPDGKSGSARSQRNVLVSGTPALPVAWPEPWPASSDRWRTPRRRGELTAKRTQRRAARRRSRLLGRGSTAVAGTMATDLVGSSGSRMTCRR